MQRWMFRLPERAAQLAGLIPTINRLMAQFAEAGTPVFDVRTIHRADRSTWSRLMLKYDYPCLIEGTADAEPVEGFLPAPSAEVIPKTANSIFLNTNLDARLRELGVTRIVLAGVFMDGCVGLSAADAAQRGLEVVLAADAIGHTRADQGASIMEWLVSMYELTCADAVSIRTMMSR